MQHGELRSNRGSRLVNELFLQFSLFNSTSPTMTVSSDSETTAREDLSGIDSYPVSVSSEHVERKERWDPLTKPTKNPKTK